MKRLIINADDYGMNEAVSRGILSAASFGAVRSTTAMVTGDDFERAMEELKSSDADLDVGIHLNLTWGRPLSDPEQIRTIVDDDGRFLPRGRFLAKSLAGAVSGAEILNELRLQCERLLDRIPSITHLDSHHHVHVYPSVRNAAERLAREFEIPYVRSPMEGLWSPWHWMAVRRFGMVMMRASRKGYWRSRGLRTPDYFGGFALGGGEGIRERWLRTLEILPDGVGEIMVHPGYRSEDNDSYDAGREGELDWLKNQNFLDCAASQGVQFTSFSEVTNRASSV